MIAILVDAEDVWLLDILPWRISTKGYLEATMYDGGWRKTVKFHHFITGTPIWEGEMVDHKNRDKLDNRRSNLEIVTKFRSAQNRSLVDNAKHYRITYAGKYEARYTRDGMTTQIGTFSTPEEAEHAYQAYCQLQDGNGTGR
jgi:hypothetical protein